MQYIKYFSVVIASLFSSISYASDFKVYYYVSDNYGNADVWDLVSNPEWDNSVITDVAHLVRYPVDKHGNLTPMTAKQWGNWNKLREWTRRTGKKLHFTIPHSMDEVRPALKNNMDNYVKQTMFLLQQLEADGVSIDIEYPKSIPDRDLLERFATKIRMQDPNLYMNVTAGYWSWMPQVHGGNWSRFFLNNGITHSVGIMSYGPNYINSMDFYKFAAWEYALKMPKHKIMPGIGFYGETKTDQGYCYKDLIKRLPQDDVTTNNIPNPKGGNWRINSTKDVYEKVKWAKQQGYGGIITWHWACDTTPNHPNSLTKAVEKAVNEFKD